MSTDPTELLEYARRLERRAEADQVLGDPLPVQRSLLNEAAAALRRAYLTVETRPTPEEAAADEIDGLRTLCRWFSAMLDVDLVQTLPPDLLPTASWLWVEEGEA